MSRKKKKDKVSLYLNPDMDGILEAAKREAEGDGNKGGTFWDGKGWTNGAGKPTTAPAFKSGPAIVQGQTTYLTPTKTYHHHYGDEVIFECDGRAVYGAKVADAELYGLDLVIDLAGLPADVKQPFVASAPAKYQALNSLVKMPEVIRLNWKDWSWPNIGMTFWKQLWILLPPKTLICCVGGHGRTGTCAASLMLASGRWTAKDAITWVRKYYCDDAIEGKGQEQYLQDLEEGLYDPEETTTV